MTRALISLILTSVVLASAPAFAQRGPSGMEDRLMKQFDMSNPQINVDDLLAPGVPKDGIPSLTNPERTKAMDADYPEPDARVIAVEINDEAAAYPLGILNWHEAVNDTVGGRPIAVTYCPLCDSAAVVDRRVKTDEGKTITLEFGISGFLYNSNMVMYDRQTNGLWSQVFMRAMTGPLAGTKLDHLPVRVVKFSQFLAEHPEGEVLTTDTGHARNYDANPYQRYFESDRVFHDFGYDDRLGPKTLGVGVLVSEDEAIFATKQAILEKGGSMTIETSKGEVKVSADDAGVQVDSAPDGVDALQTFYHSWSAFHPETSIIASKKQGGSK